MEKKYLQSFKDQSSQQMGLFSPKKKVSNSSLTFSKDLCRFVTNLHYGLGCPWTL